jgi:hypothetical protein
VGVSVAIQRKDDVGITAAQLKLMETLLNFDNRNPVMQIVSIIMVEAGSPTPVPPCASGLVTGALLELSCSLAV